MPANNNVNGGLFTKTDDTTNTENDKMSKELHDSLGQVFKEKGNIDLQGTSAIMAETGLKLAAIEQTIDNMIHNQQTRGVIAPQTEIAKGLIQSIGEKTSDTVEAKDEETTTFKP